MNRFEQMPQRITAGAAVLLSSVALVACGVEGQSSGHVPLDRGNGKIPECPSMYAVGQPINHTGEVPAAINREINAAVSDLADSLPRNVRGEALESFSHSITGGPPMTPKEEKANNAAWRIFFTDSATGTYRDRYILDENKAGNIDSKVDDLSEEFCAKGSEVYLSYKASEYIDSLVYAGVHAHALSKLDALKGRLVSVSTRVTN